MIIPKFGGILPKYEDNPPVGMATVAQNIDLSSGKIRPIREDKLVESTNPDDIADHNDLVYYAGRFYSAKDAKYLKWVFGADVDGDTMLDILIFLDENGKLMKRVNGSDPAAVGTEVPGKPTVEDTGLPPGAIFDESSVLHILPDSDTYEWFPSADNFEYYLATPAGGDPTIDRPGFVKIRGSVVEEGTVGSLGNLTWGWGDNALDSLGFNTVYVKTRTNASQLYWAPPETNYDPDYLWPSEIWIPPWREYHYSGGMFGSWTDHPGQYGPDPDYLNHQFIHLLFLDSIPSNVDVINMKVRYVITASRNVNGHVDESGPSKPSAELDLENSTARVTRPALNQEHVTHWNIYRLDESTAEYLYVAQKPIGDLYHDDSAESSSLGGAIPTWYRSIGTGNTILFEPPPENVDCLANELYAGMLLYSKGSRLYANEPGLIDAHNSDYYWNLPSRIKSILVFAGHAAIFTETGVHRVDGFDPENMIPTKVMGDEPCVGNVSVGTTLGAVYLGDSGLALFNAVQTIVATEDVFDEAWFKANINVETARLVESDGVLRILHDKGQLIVDHRSKPFIFTTRDDVVKAAYARPEDGKLFLLKRDGVYEAGEGDDFIEWTWRSGNLLKGTVYDIPWYGCYLTGGGNTTLKVYVDGALISEKELQPDHSLIRKRRLKLPEHTQGKACQIELSGSGYIDEAEVV